MSSRKSAAECNCRPDPRVVSAMTGLVTATSESQVLAGDEVISGFRAQGLDHIETPPPRRFGEGPFSRLVIRGCTLIDGTGAPPAGNTTVVVEGDRIARIINGDAAELPVVTQSERQGGADRVIDATGMYLLPGFVDSHAHIGYPQQGLLGKPAPADYIFLLWLTHGITTVREVGSANGLTWTLEQSKRSERNEITAPRIVPYAFVPFLDARGKLDPEGAKTWVRNVAARGAAGIKFFGAHPKILEVMLKEAQAQGLKSAFHHAQQTVVQLNALHSARLGLTSVEHWYGLPEAMFEDRIVQGYSSDYDYNNEAQRFAEAGRLWGQASKPYGEKWVRTRDELIALDLTIVPTLTIYEANRDLMSARRAEWHEDCTWPTLWRYFEPNPKSHGSYWHNWTTANEIEWKNNYRLWMMFLNDYKNHGGRITVGSDSGFLYKVYGFGYIRELELLQEAGFHPLEVIRSATVLGAELLDKDEEIGSIAEGKKADLVITPQNPLANFKTLYATGAMHLDRGVLGRIGGVRWTIKDGILYDAPELLKEVRAMVAQQKTLEAQLPDTPAQAQHPGADL